MRFKLFVLVFFVDQATKWWVLLCQPDFRFGNGPFNGFGVKLNKSSGYLFGLFSVIKYQRWLIILFVVCILFLLQLFYRFYWIQFRRNKLTYISFSLIIGGFCGNFSDCLMFEYVRDFILIPFFGRANLADGFLISGLWLVFIEFCINSDFRKVLFKLRPLHSEIELIAPIFKLPVQDIKKLIHFLNYRVLRGKSGSSF